jgi:hypothetical protein
MALPTLTEFKAYLGTDLSANDTYNQDVLDAAVSTVEHYCARPFAVAGAATARVYVPQGSIVRFHDCTTVTSIAVNGSTVATTSYQLEPLNALSWSGQARPYEQARRIDGVCWYVGPYYYGNATVTVTATWGWTAIPDEVKQATLILGKDIAKNRDVAFGIAAFTEYAAIRVRENSTVAALLADFRRDETLGI